MALKENDKRFWEQVKLLAEKNLKKATYDYFVTQAHLISVTGDKVKILVDSEMHKDWWRNQSDLINTAAMMVYGGPVDYNLFSSNELSDTEYKELNQISASSINTENGAITDSNVPYPFPSNLMPRYTFENFIVGKPNQLAIAAAQAVADTQTFGSTYNPLFIWGGSGLGKTHILHAIGNEYSKKNRHAHVLYVSAETFVNDYVNTFNRKKMDRDTFINKYRNLDLLLVDDIQFFNNQEGSINEFFSTFNALWDNGKQIVIVSDRPYSELTNLQERLISRFSQGLPIDVHTPDFETRLAILMDKATRLNLDFPDDTLAYIAGQVTSNVRELEGVLNQVEFTAKQQNVATVDISVAEKVIEARKVRNDGFKRTNLTINKVKDEVAKYYHLPLTDLTGPKRVKEIANARQVAMYLIRELLGTSLPAIGNEFGKRDHTTVMYAVRQVTDKMKNDSDIQRDVDNLRRKLE